MSSRRSRSVAVRISGSSSPGQEPRIASEAVEHVLADPLTLGQPGVLEVLGRVVGHRQPLHHGTAAEVPLEGEGHDLVQPQTPERQVERRPRRLGRVTVAPGGVREPPADLGAGRERCLERRSREPREADELPCVAHLERPEPVAVGREPLRTAVELGVGLRPGQRCREVLHDDRVRVERSKRIAVLLAPLPQEESLGDRLENVHDGVASASGQ